MKIRIALFASLLAVPGCFNVDYVHGPQAAGDPPPNDVEMQLMLIDGLVPLSGTVNLKDVCPNGFTKVHTEQSIVDWVVTDLVGILTPRTYEVWCSNSAGAFNFDVDQDGHVVGLHHDG